MNNLIKLRKMNNLSQEEVAKFLGISHQMISNYEVGRCDVPLSYLIKLAKFYHVSLDYLILGEDNGYIITKAEYEILMSAKEVLNNLGSRYEPSKSININNTTFNNGGDVNIKNK